MPEELETMWDAAAEAVSKATNGAISILDFAEAAWCDLSPQDRERNHHDTSVWLCRPEAYMAVIRRTHRFLAARLAE